MLLNHLSIEQVENKIGFKPSFFPFNSVIALALAKNHKVNPFVNNGAIATTAALCHLYPNNSLCWDDIQSFFNEMADDHLECHKHLKSDKSNKNVFNKIVLDESVFESEFNNDQHNYGLANLLDSWGNLDEDVNKAVKTYTKQCSLRVSAEHLSIMASCLANGGKHPITGNQLIKEKNVKHILSLMLSCGLYQESGEWSVYVGVPAKSGVGGGIMMVVPGKFGIGIVSPPLNKAGNSYLGWEIGKMLSKNLGINIFDVKQ
jgi:glutaminase